MLAELATDSAVAAGVGVGVFVAFQILQRLVPKLNGNCRPRDVPTRIDHGERLAGLEVKVAALSQTVREGFRRLEKQIAEK